MFPNRDAPELAGVDDAPTFPKRPPLEPVLELFGLEPKGLELPEPEPKRPPADPPPEDGGLKLNDMAREVNRKSQRGYPGR